MFTPYCTLQTTPLPTKVRPYSVEPSRICDLDETDPVAVTTAYGYAAWTKLWARSGVSVCTLETKAGGGSSAVTGAACVARGEAERPGDGPGTPSSRAWPEAAWPMAAWPLAAWPGAS